MLQQSLFALAMSYALQLNLLEPEAKAKLAL
jgi:hypothetical protein